MTASLAMYRERARAHAAEIDLSVRYVTVNDIAKMFGVSASTIRDIPRDQLPYKEFGSGVKLKRRRYHPLDVAAFANSDRGQELLK